MASSTVVLTVDLQLGFLDPGREPYGKPPKALCLPNTLRLLDHARVQGWRVIHAITEHSDSNSLPQPLRDRGKEAVFLAGSPAAKLVPGIRMENESVIRKTSYSAFVDTPLEEELGECNRLLVAGIAADCCVLQTAFDASARIGIPTVVPYECVSASRAESYAAGIRTIAKSAACVTSVETVLNGPFSWRDALLEEDSAGTASMAWFEQMNQRLEPVETRLIGIEGADDADARLSEVLDALRTA